MDRAAARDLHQAAVEQVERGGASVDGTSWDILELALVQILIGVANRLLAVHWRGEGFRSH